MFRKKNNPFYEKLKAVNVKQPFIGHIQRAFYLGGFPYSSVGCELVEKAIRENRLSTFIAECSYDTHTDNIELYFVGNDIGLYQLVAILDPFELYSPEELLMTIPCGAVLIDGLAEIEQIYP